MVLNREDHRVLGRGEGVLFDGFNDIQEADFACDCVAVVDERHPFRSVPAVQLDATASLIQTAGVRLHTRNARELIAR